MYKPTSVTAAVALRGSIDPDEEEVGPRLARESHDGGEKQNTNYQQYY